MRLQLKPFQSAPSLLFTVLSPWSLVLLWLKLSIHSSEIILAGVMLQAAFDFFMILIIIYFIFQAPVISRDVLSASIVAYLFVVLFFANSFFVTLPFDLTRANADRSFGLGVLI